MIEQTTFTDISGRTFSNISPFEYVLWALDTRYMVNMMLDCLPHNERGLMIAEKLNQQYKRVAKDGVTYTLEGKTITEKHFDCSVLINALQSVANYDQWNALQRQSHWCTVVGIAQRYLPAHIIQHYCDFNTPFSPTPSFTAEQFVRSLRFLNWDSIKKISWTGTSISGDRVIGVNFAISRGLAKGAGGGSEGKGRVAFGGPQASNVDLVALKTLCEVRTKDFSLLESRLENLCQNLDEQKESNNCVV